MIRIDDISKRYEDGILALNHLSISIAEGQIFTLLGSNGAGKSTTINIICGFIPPTTGDVVINNCSLMKNPVEIKQHIAYLSENVLLYNHFTGFQNLQFFARLSGKNMSKSDLENVLREIGLQDRYIHKNVDTYSKGMRQKIGIAIALVKDASVFLLDEPFSGLDPKAAFDFQNLLMDLKQKGKTILMSTHDIFRAKEMADVVGIMKDGCLVMIKTREEMEHDDLQQIYLDYMEGRLA
ncbi:MAG: ABC transporter ATP-binding protein [Candidatus Cloacimonetes bacterium]|nr:ABC transporter ATP-binding protein [Candidatus Cloacimonadota bacterium]